MSNNKSKGHADKDDRDDEHERGKSSIVGTRGPDVLIGTAGNDVINGRDGGDTINGLGGNDIINGGKGNDVVDGGAGNDRINGGKGDDTLTGGAGNDDLKGGSGRDTAVFSGKYTDYKISFIGHHEHDHDDDDYKITVTDRRAGYDGTDTLKGVEVLKFADGEYRDGQFYPSNVAPTAPAQSADATEGGTSVTVNALGTATDANGDALTVVNVPASLPAGVSYDAATHSFAFDPGNAAYDSLAAGATQAIVVSYGVSDGTVTTPTSVSFTITGTNDAAVLSSAIVALNETNAPLTTGGTLTNTDVDNPSLFVAQTNVAGANGQFSIDVNGNWTYTADSAFDNLNVGQPVSDTFTVFAADGTKTTVQVTINGTDDQSVLSSATANLTESNAAADISAAGTLTLSDPDSATTFVAQAGTAGSYGTFVIGTDGAWTYTANSAHDEFVAGTTYTDTFSVSASDGTTTTVTVNIGGSNDAPTTTPVALAAITEDSGARLITQSELLANAGDMDGPSLSAINLAITGGSARWPITSTAPGPTPRR